MKKDYSELLRDPQWQKKRLEIFQRDEFMCQFCHNDAEELHVHHRRYIRGNKPWEYGNEDLITLCKSCHSEIEKLKQAVVLKLDFEPTHCAIAQLVELFDSEHWFELVQIIFYLHRDRGLIEPFFDKLKADFQKRKEANDNINTASA